MILVLVTGTPSILLFSLLTISKVITISCSKGDSLKMQSYANWHYPYSIRSLLPHQCAQVAHHQVFFYLVNL